MKYSITPGHLVYVITFGKVETGRVLNKVHDKFFLVDIPTSKRKIEAKYGVDMFLTEKKAEERLAVIVKKHTNKAQVRQSNENSKQFEVSCHTKRKCMYCHKPVSPLSGSLTCYSCRNTQFNVYE
ncbi:hypothetical protein LGQ02_02810 [Bacillus shivajii]|uniref:hypothetical protein n=1 Tax=Bacillus shivajii TaxID=1983719 RepID=UPI001CFB1CF3|nr:hypothetical protein [Bacillus shivajii]UCZ53735.1 hypothetical protein LGQ02_02810 [Bacillus shivajii]